MPLVGENRRREAVDKVTAMQFDRHGNRIWRDARALLDSEHARYAAGAVAVPYGTCTQPANVQAGGGACPVRFRCAGCDHFRTDVSHLPDLTGYLDDLLRTREQAFGCLVQRPSQESLVLSTLPGVAGASRSALFPDSGTPAGTVVLCSSDLRVHGSGTVSADGCAPSAGELAVFCRPVVTAPAVVRRDGTVLADGWLPDLVRLGGLERHLGGGVIEAIVDGELREGRLKPRQRRRIMSYPLVIRLMIAMTLMPDASYREALARLAGLLADVPFALEWHVPTGKVVTEWRLLIPAEVMESLFWRAAGPLIAGDGPSAVMLAGMPACAADGMLVNVADTPANRAFFGSTHELVTAILDAGGHVVARAAGTLSLPMAPGGGWLPDGSRLTWLNAPSGKEPVG